MNTGLVILASYYIILNIVTFAIFGIDKQKRKNKKDRISENAMFFMAMFGGALGGTFGMNFFKNKQHHKNFYLGMPALLLLHVVIILLILQAML